MQETVCLSGLLQMERRERAIADTKEQGAQMILLRDERDKAPEYGRLARDWTILVITMLAQSMM